ncbi:MAG: FmdE family protein [Desulfitobacteriaceae bacterium]
MCVEKTPWEQVIDFHGHTCPEVAVGFRVAQLAQHELGIRPAPNSELLVTAETHSCALDAFQVLNKATVGRGALRIEEKRKHVYYFQYSGTETLVRIAVKESILEHITAPETFSSPRQRQNWALENIQYVLSSTEEDFCSVQKVPGVLEKWS